MTAPIARQIALPARARKEHDERTARSRLVRIVKPRSNKRQQRRADLDSRQLWCSWGQHRTSKHQYLREQFPGGTMCMGCQLKIVENVEAAIEMPAVTEAIARQSRQRHELKKLDARMQVMLDAAGAEGWVYYMRINGRIKIGYTTNLRQRSRNYPPGTELLAVEPGDRDLEARRHAQFSRSLAQGREWFAESEDLVQHISALAEQYATPKNAMHNYSVHEGIKHV